MATTKKTTKTTSESPQTEAQSALTRMREDRARIDAQIKAATAVQRAENAAKRAASHRSLEQVIAQQQNKLVTHWTARPMIARVAERMRAGQEREQALDEVFAQFRAFIVNALDQRAERGDGEGTAQKSAT